MKKILGLDLGTNSIGWAVIDCNEVINSDKIDLKPVSIEAAGSRIIPMDAATIGDFNRGNSVSQTKERTFYRSARRLRERELLRRSRLHRVLSIINFLPKHYLDSLDRYGNILKNKEPKLPWRLNSEGKYEFIFKSSFNEMLKEFQLAHPSIISNAKLIPYDWTIYYLRKKALIRELSKEELAWIILTFNQKRGYYQLRGEDNEEDNSKLVEYKALKIIDVKRLDANKSSKGELYAITLENGDIYKRISSIPLNWIGQIKDFIVTTEIDDNGKPKYDKEGSIKRSYRSPKEDDWTLLKKKTEKDIDNSHKTIGEYIYDSILKDPDQKIKGKLVRTIERKYYKEELKLILQKQMEFIPELCNEDLFNKCVEELYPLNDSHRNIVLSKDFTYLFVDDIIFYQRPLKSKKNLISECPYEFNLYNDPSRQEKQKSYLKCIAKSHPLFQEFRIWQFISNLRIFAKEYKVNNVIKTDVDVTSDFLKNDKSYSDLFEWINCREKIDQKSLMDYFNIKNVNKSNYRWNYVEEKSYPGNETHAQILSFLKKSNENSDFLNTTSEEMLWQILYSINDKSELAKALHSYALKYSLSESFEETFKKFPPFKKEYGSYSAKAIKKMLPLMRMGSYWKESEISSTIKDNFKKILLGEIDIPTSERVIEILRGVTELKGLPLWLVTYIVYGKHSESREIVKWESPSDIDKFLSKFKQYSLRNPIVEQIILECLRVVRDIWKQVGQIDEIHIELGREMKNPADKRRIETERLVNNENRNLRIKAILTEFLNPDYSIECVNPNSPSHQEIFKIYEDYALSSKEKYDAQSDSFISDEGVPDDIINIIKKFESFDQKNIPTKSDINRYRLWLEQRYRSPYTGKMIPLSKLFTTDYQIEHVIPQSLYFDNSFNNKVICESAVNKLKDNSLGMEFIMNHQGEKVNIGFGKYVEILSPNEYIEFVRRNYSANKTKMSILLSDEIPEKFISRQMNDSRYISKFVMHLLSNIVREKDENGVYENEAISKNVIPVVGQITDFLKKDWGLNDVWNRIILPRFERMNKITDSSEFTYINNQGHVVPNMPDKYRRGFNFKRIDHRHHAMDAIVIACTTKDHVNLLNNSLCSKSNKEMRYDLQRKLRRFERVTLTDGRTINVAKEFLKPWDNFTVDTEATLSNIIISFKKNIRIINRCTNYYTHYADGKKVQIPQEGKDNWAIRKSLHKETVFAYVNLKKIKTVSLEVAIKNPNNIVNKDFRRFIIEQISTGHDFKFIKKMLSIQDNKDIWNDINLSKIEVYYFSKENGENYYASRKPLDSTFDKKKILESVTDTGIQKILLAHLELKEKPEIAFSPDGIEEMNKNIVALNSGKNHKPIYKVRVYEQANKYAVGTTGNKNKKFVEAAKGTNLYVAIYETISKDKKTGEEKIGRRYETIPIKTIIDRQKQGLAEVPELDINGNKLLFTLSPGDLVYLPKSNNIDLGETYENSRIYKMVSCSGRQIFFIPYSVANVLVNKYEYTSLNKSENSIDGQMIKETCIPINVDRLGNLI